MRIVAAGESLELFPLRAAYWERERTLFVADTHFGKTAAFRAAGIAAPETVTAQDLAKLGALLEHTNAARLVILGDFFHAKGGRIPETESRIGAWRQHRAAVEIVLVRGNHDRGAGDPPLEWNIRCVPPGEVLGPFILCHAPEDTVRAEVRGYRLCGHLHPAVIVHDGTFIAAERLACFLFDDDMGILPAFGRFTGMRAVQPRPRQRVYAVADGEVLHIPHRGLSAPAGKA